MSKKSYPILSASTDTLTILKVIGKSAIPITPSSIATATSLTYAKTMTHIATLLNSNLIEERDGGYIGSIELASLWAMRKAQLLRREEEIIEEKKLLGVE